MGVSRGCSGHPPQRGLRLPGASLALAAAALAGCASGDETEARSITERDSAAIRIVENAAPAWDAGRGWRAAPTPEVVIGASSSPTEDGDEIPLYGVEGARLLPDGGIVVANAGTSEVMVFDTAGTLVRRFGGEGEGPGELRSIVGIHVCGGDSIAVHSRLTLHVFERDGTFARRAQFRLGGQPVPVQGVSGSCGRALVQQRTRMPAVDRQGFTEDVFAWVDSFSEAVDTVATTGLLEVWTRAFDGGARPWVIPWGTSGGTHATGNDRFVVGNGRVPELRHYDSGGGLQLIVRWPGQPRPVSASDRRRYSERRMEFLAWAPANEPETGLLFPALDEYPEVPTHKPLFDRLLLDGRGGIWARVFPEQSFGLFDTRLPGPMVFTETWTVFDSAGIWLGDLTLPDRFELHDVDGDRLLGVARDALDTETVQIFRIVGMQSGQAPTGGAAAGLLIVVAGFLPHPARLWASALLFLAMVTIPIAYSYLVWRDVGEGYPAQDRRQHRQAARRPDP